MGAFSDGVKSSIGRMQSQLNTRIVTQAEELFRNVVNYSPTRPDARFAKGELINNWWLGVGEGNYNRTHSSACDFSGTSSYSQAAQLQNVKEFLGKDGEVSFTNSTPYVLLAEYTGWPSPKWSGNVGPYGMIRLAMNDNAAKYKDKT